MLAISVLASWLVVAAVFAGLVLWWLSVRFALVLICHKLEHLDVQPAPWWAGKRPKERGSSESQ